MASTSLLLPLLLFLTTLGLIYQPVDSLPQRGKEIVLEQPPSAAAADSITSETAVVRQVASLRRSNAIPKSQVVKIANLTRQHEGDEFKAHGESNQR